MPKKILFAISDTGGGHRSAALALTEAIRQAAGEDVNCTMVDFLKATQLPGIRNAPAIYNYASSRKVWLYDFFFRLTNDSRRMDRITNLLFPLAASRFEAEIRTVNPDLVVVVHPLLVRAICAARKKGGFRWPVITVVTDLVSFHASWAYAESDLCLAPTEEAARILAQYGVPPEKIIYTGFPVHPKFSTSHSQQQARQALGINPDAFTVLITGGGVGSGKMYDIVKTLEKVCPDKQLLVITGNNKELYQTLSAGRQPGSLTHVYGFVNNMETMMAASDIVVTKAGPGTIMEVLAMRRPLVITQAVGVQETGNIDFVVNHKLGFSCSDPAGIAQIVNRMTQPDAAWAVNSENLHKIPADGAGKIAGLIRERLASLT
ncbi:MGDG synthase family glycosyltransferase [Acetonema longum]|uniref:Monogalactosyldiacylglycerol synthase n=1 Tax=Acetonema longum DSM 6540 TaxID=1009370 RepID=F7NIB7_9FIRM|nr:glycosyltransferase [Acetonema longum]EGO64223.1 monogalactosyldiacylglycerol synthase [Acetonema longum DSM 6540]